VIDRASARTPALLLALVGVGAACAGLLPQATSQDVERAQARWPATTLDDLARGRARYVAKCSGCHTLHLPQDVPPERWSKELDEMTEKAKLTPEDRAEIERFLVTLAARPPGP
jgi:mono/diheme cytochrome c family protein